MAGFDQSWGLHTRTVSSYRMRGLVNNLCWTLDGEAGPFLHCRAVYVLFRVLLWFSLS